MSLREDLKRKAVVGVNEYKPKGMLPTGHVNVSFYFHGIDQGTYGQNIAGNDLKGRLHAPDPIHGAGGVFVEHPDGAMTHYVIVSGINHYSMLAYAQSRAKLTAASKSGYGFIGNNCADFVYQVFAHSDLPPKFKVIPDYLQDKLEPVAIYAEGEALQRDPKTVLLRGR